MNKISSKIDLIKERNEQKKIAIEIFDSDTKAHSLTNSDESKKRLKEFYDIAYKNIQFRCSTNDNHALEMAWNVFKEEIDIEKIKKKKCISFFVFGNKTYEIVVEGEVFFQFYENILSFIKDDEIIITDKKFSFALSILIDEHFISVSHWDDNIYN